MNQPTAATQKSDSAAATDAPFLKLKSYGVLGAGRSGRAAAAMLARLGKQVALLDDFEKPEADAFGPLVAQGVTLRFGAQVTLGSDLEALAVSPGVPATHRLVQEAALRDLPMLSEMELGWLVRGGARCVAITGTNGKTTVTMLVQQLLADSGLRAVACGNIGLPLCDAVAQAGEELAQTVFAAEVSSFQLETSERFAPEVALILNVTPDHLDRHHTMEEYAALKERITASQGPEQVLVINQDDPFCMAIGARSRARVRRFSLERAVEDGAWLDGDLLMLARPGQRPRRLMEMSELKMVGLHNVANALAAAVAADSMGVGREQIVQTLTAFRAAPHRMEWVASQGGVTYINDSKATNLDAMARAIVSFDGGIHLIAGGRDKASPFATITPQLQGRVSRLYLIGEAAEPMRQAWGEAIACQMSGTLEQALEDAAARAREGEVVLLSPGCASFDQFTSYSHRGKVFRAWVCKHFGLELPEEIETDIH